VKQVEAELVSRGDLDGREGDVPIIGSTSVLDAFTLALSLSGEVTEGAPPDSPYLGLAADN